ncbi:calcium/sodium antiporter [uncultured Imperialibacter sp.]|uniref:calcium/sodium antiporter n=1 Tax=uncultured Imperialibacter sp. TaxID=1672639 RepID=UPI0030D8BEDE|tara:strand:- start:1598 stop:2554 length:957 start_codon:yes stop_codon:yes gene_type:complete
MTLHFVLLLVGFAILIKGADWMVSGASSLAKRINVSNLMIGLTVVAFGTSAPELTVNLFASSSGLNDAMFGNIIGSNIFNLLFILGVAGVIYPLSVQRTTVKYEIPYSLFSALLLFFLVNDAMFFGADHNSLGQIDALVLLVFFGLFMAYIIRQAKNETQPQEEIQTMTLLKSVLFVTIGIALLVGGGKLVTDHAVAIAASFGLSEKLIGLTILAAGTSLPELATSAVAAFRRNTDIAIGNVVGSNIFNILLILGINGGIREIPYNATLNMDFFVIFFGSVALLLFMFTFNRNKLDRVEAVMFLVAFVGYTGYLIYRN